ncbi:MAG: FTR1 family iron permease [Lachnospiraceae bacterium]|nr:FTR1 family iron permease [Lachnospiraceae bacterium]
MKKIPGRILSLLAVMMLLICMISQKAYAADDGKVEDYYLSFKKYKTAVNPDGSKTITYNDITDQISNLLNEGIRRYESGVEYDGDNGYYKPFTNSYGFWYETSGFEKTVMGYISGARVNEVELQFSNMKKAVNNGESVERVTEEVKTLIKLLREDADILDELFGYTKDGESGGGIAWATFGAVFAIILREGLEAILIVGAMVAYLIKTGNKRGTLYVYAGGIIALAASVGLAILLYSITSSTSNSIPQEIVEGVTALVAVAVLIYVSNWMISKAESEAWTNYISGKVTESADKGKMRALGFTSFLAVFREGAEVILFCQQYFSRADSMENGYVAVFGGIIAGLVAVAVVFIVIRVFGIKLPLKPFFMATSILMAIMSIAFLGSGMFELFLDGRLAENIGGFVQDLAGTIPALEWMNGSDVLTFLGVYPTWITLGPQIILTIITIVTFIMMIKKGSKNKKVNNNLI